MLSGVIQEELVHSFNFYWQGEIYKGMRCTGELYICSRRFGTTYKSQIDEYTDRLRQNGLGVVITEANGYWVVWVNLRSLNSLPSYSPMRDEFAYLLEASATIAISFEPQLLPC